MFENYKLITMRPILALFLCVIFQNVNAQFFTQYWAQFDGRISNWNIPNASVRAEDATMSIHPIYSKTHKETQINGLQLITVNEAITDIKRAEVLLEMWGGHPETSNKRFSINGRGTYHLPGKENTMSQCEYIFPSTPITTSDLVTGVNGIQFACDKGEGSWGTFIVNETAVRCYLRDNDKRILDNGLIGFSVKPSIEKMDDITEIKLPISAAIQNQIAQVHYFARYDGYDDRGDGNGSGWHGYTFKQIYTNHIGTATQAPFSINWDTQMIPTEGRAMAVKAIIEFKNGLFYETKVLDNLWFKKDRPTVLLIPTTDTSEPFWAQLNRPRYAKITLPVDPKEIESAELLVRIWDGGEGDVKEPFKVNGVAYPVTSGKAIHDLIYSKNKVDPANLKFGENAIELVVDTHHHGIEMLLPFPALLIKLKTNRK